MDVLHVQMSHEIIESLWTEKMHITTQIISDHLKAPEVGLKTFLVNKIITGALAVIFATRHLYLSRFLRKNFCKMNGAIKLYV